jgi:cation:H+ antiporter
VTTTDEDLDEDVHPGRQRLSLLIAFAATVPGIVLAVSSPQLTHWVEALLFGLAIVGSAFLLSWAAEVAQLDISAGLAIAVLAFIAVLPEYAVDFVLALDGGHGYKAHGALCQSPAAVRAGEDSPCSLALANMTGANRLLIGIGWSLVAFIAWRQWQKRGQRHTGINLDRSHSVELSYLAVATFYSITLPLKRSITLIDAAILVTIFVMYTVRISKAPAEEPHLVGPARWLGGFRTSRRRAAVLLLFVFAAGVILLVAENFAHALVATGREFGISEFLLIQWLAPLASEAPELLVAGLYAWRLNTSAGLGTLVSSKVNQWTLLVGTLPIAFAIASGSTHGLPLAPRQREELLLTAAQSVFALAVLVNRSLSNREALGLFSLFWAQFILGAIVPAQWHGKERVVVSVVYLALALRTFLVDRHALPRLFKDGFRTPYARLQEE